MNEIINILAITGLFLLRVGIPVLMLALIGILIDRWQGKREEQIRTQYMLKVQERSIDAVAEREELKRAS